MGVESFVEQGLPVCEAIDTTNADFSKINKAFENIKRDDVKFRIVGDNIVLNGQTVTSDIMVASQSFHDGKYHQFGQMMGQLVMAAAVDENNMYLY